MQKHAVNMSTRKIWHSTINFHETQFSNLVKLISLILSILGSKSQVERTFRTVTNILLDKIPSMNHNTLENCLVILGNNSLWKKHDKEEIIQAIREPYMIKWWKKQIDNVVVSLTCDGDESNTEGSGSNSDLGSEDDLVIDDLENTHHDEGASTSEIESSGREEREGGTDDDLLSDYEREEQRKQHSEMVWKRFFVQLLFLFRTSWPRL